MPLASIESTKLESSPMQSPNSHCVSPKSDDEKRCFHHLRGVQWRINLGILPSSSSSSVDDLRRVTADYRRRYAGLRRRLLLDPRLPMDRTSSPNLVMDNPLSQNPDSMWGRFFQNAELEKLVDQDLSRLYPENGSYFQTPGCQGMLRRILLLWCLRHPEYGYRQGMHELLAPLLYVVHVDVQRLYEVRRLYHDHFADKFDGLSFHENDLTYNFELKKFPDLMKETFSNGDNTANLSSLDDLDCNTQTIVLLSDGYGAEGELGIVLSEKFVEHDVFSMFDALMTGSGGAVAMADFFSSSPATGSQTGLPPVIEASSSLYHLLSIADPSLHGHLIELGVEPQYFALRWLRVLFGREFSLLHLLSIWDEIFASESIAMDSSNDDTFGILRSPRGALISAMAVSLLLYLRSSLLATENATSCLQRLLNFPDTVNLKDLIAKAKSLQLLALNADFSSSSFGPGCVSSDSPALKAPLILVPESYWEEKWRVLHKAEELQKKSDSSPKKGWSEKFKLRLLRTESCPSPAIIDADLKECRPPVRRSLAKDFSKDHNPCEEIEKSTNQGLPQNIDPLLFFEAETETRECVNNSSSSGNGGSDENSSVFSDPSCPNDNESQSSVVSNISVDENCSEETIIDPPGGDLFPLQEVKDYSVVKSSTLLKEKKISLGRFPWFWRFGRNAGTEMVASEKGGSDCAGSSLCSKEDCTDPNAIVNLRNIGQSMLENIQVIEATLQQSHGQVENLEQNAGNGAMAALKELGKISNLLSGI